jgi:hypothetical protein
MRLYGCLLWQFIHSIIAITNLAILTSTHVDCSNCKTYFSTKKKHDVRVLPTVRCYANMLSFNNKRKHQRRGVNGVHRASVERDLRFRPGFAASSDFKF